MTLELRDVTKSVGGALHIQRTSLVLPRGTLSILLGPTLSGKTSLMRLMAGLDRPTSGRVFFDRACALGEARQREAEGRDHQLR